jgi:pSer/pThr/pTyr-binding forkhead associated (FHA) protein
LLDTGIMPWYFAGSLNLKDGAEFDLPAAGLELILGRGRDADVRVAPNGVARRHARLSWNAAGDLVVEDLGSTNGTTVNGVALRDGPHVLRAGDRLTLALSFDFEIVSVV